MPELPEVETVKRGLLNLIVGKKFKSVNFDNPKSYSAASADTDAFLLGAKIIAVRRRAKVLMIDLDSKYSLVIHLKMTGQLVFVPAAESILKSNSLSSEPKSIFLTNRDLQLQPILKSKIQNLKSTVAESEARFAGGHPNDSLVGNLPDKSTHVTFEFTDGSHLFFNDQRKFGWVRLIPTAEIPNIDFMKRVGPEPLEADFTSGQFAQRFKRRPNSTIKAALLDQSVIAGVGNIYADESLWGARIHPTTRVADVSAAKFKLLYTELRAVMNLSIEKGGSTNRNYVNAEGKKGSYMDFANVFRREGQSCARCGTEIIKLRVAGRGTHICPRCQRQR